MGGGGFWKAVATQHRKENPSKVAHAKSGPSVLRVGALRGTNLRGQTKPKRRFLQRFSLIFGRFSCLFLENKAFEKTADFRREPQKTAGTRRKPQIGVCPLRFVPLTMESQTRVSKRAPREFRNWRVQGNPLTLRQPFANPSPTLRQPFANLFCQPFLPTFSANPSPTPSFCV